MRKTAGLTESSLPTGDRAGGAETTLSNAISAETTRAGGVEATKANLAGGNIFTGGNQMIAPSTSSYASLNVPNTGAASSTPAMGDIWSIAVDPHLQFRDLNNVTQSLAFLGDITSQGSQTLTAAENYTNTKVGAETTRATGVEANLSTAIGSEAARAVAAEATKANLSGGNSFSGNQSISGNESVSGNLAVARTLSIGGGTAITEHLSALFNPRFPLLHPATCATASFAFNGVSDGDTTALGVPNARMQGDGNFVYTAWVSAANTITLQECNVSGTNQHTAGSGNIRVDVWKH
jgi:hypothetical protein